MTLKLSTLCRQYSRCVCTAQFCGVFSWGFWFVVCLLLFSVFAFFFIPCLVLLLFIRFSQFASLYPSCSIFLLFLPPSLFSTYTLIDHIFTDSQDLVHTVSVTNNSTHQWPLPVLCTWSIKLSRHACTHRLHHHSNRTFQRFNKEAILFTEAVLFSVMFIILNAPDDAM